MLVCDAAPGSEGLEAATCRGVLLWPAAATEGAAAARACGCAVGSARWPPAWQLLAAALVLLAALALEPALR